MRALGWGCWLSWTVDAYAERERESRDKERAMQSAYAGEPRERTRERKDAKCGERRVKRRRERRRFAAAGRAVSCRQIYRMARADPEQCRFVLFCFLDL